MTFGIQRDRSWMKPLTPEGNVQTDDPDLQGITGCHPLDSPSAGFNILGALPGCEYTHERLPTPSDNTLLRIRAEGGEIMRTGDPDRAAYTLFTERGDPRSHGAASPLDSIQSNGEVMAVRWPEHAVRAKHEREQRKALAMSRGGAEDYVKGASAAERVAAGNRPSRFRRADHSLQSEDSGGNVVDTWQPEGGIIREG